MIMRSLDNNNDWTFGKGKNNYLKNIDALKLNILTRLRSWRGDCFFDLVAGVDYYNYLDRSTKDFLDRDVKRVVLQTPNVIKLTYFESDIVDRKYIATIGLVSIFGTTEVNI